MVPTGTDFAVLLLFSFVYLTLDMLLTVVAPSRSSCPVIGVGSIRGKDYAAAIVFVHL